ncbi:MAG: Bifunctional non-ous end joining protein LigD [Bacilli bacterium]|nr:Bifunctional non-ous end joining protein LigD [Bacilli bacterium]
MLPFIPMSPILINEIPSGKEWGHQLKWDGYRIIAWVDNGKVELYTKKMLSKNSKFPDLVEALSELKGTFLLDGEAVILDPKTNRPSFQQLQQHDKKRNPQSLKISVERNQIQYIIFDLLQVGEEDLRQYPFIERYERLQKLAGQWNPPLFITELFDDGEALWQWVEKNDWEGVVSKRLTSRYREGKEHHDWYKRKRMLKLEVDIVGILYKEGRLSSLVMRKDGQYLGRASLGLNETTKSILRGLPTEKKSTDYFMPLPEGLRNERILWLNKSFAAEVTGLEITEAGSLRHPKIVSLAIMMR